MRQLQLQKQSCCKWTAGFSRISLQIRHVFQQYSRAQLLLTRPQVVVRVDGLIFIASCAISAFACATKTQATACFKDAVDGFFGFEDALTVVCRLFTRGADCVCLLDVLAEGEGLRLGSLGFPRSTDPFRPMITRRPRCTSTLCKHYYFVWGKSCR